MRPGPTTTLELFLLRGGAPSNRWARSPARTAWWRTGSTGGERGEPTAAMEFVPAVIARDEDAEVAIVVRIASHVTIEIAKASPRMIAEIVGELARTS